MLVHRNNNNPTSRGSGRATRVHLDPSNNNAHVPKYGNHRRQQRRKKILFLFFCACIASALLMLNFWGHQRLVSQSEIHLYNAFVSATAPITKNTTQIASFSAANKGGRVPTNHACDGYRGIYHVEKGDMGGAAGTVFFQFVIGQIIWAEKYNFKPWVYMNNVSYVIYDPLVHGRGTGVSFQMMDGLTISYIQRPNGHWRDFIPGEPTDFDKLRPKTFQFSGDGIWEDYFEPVSDFVPGDISCRDKPLVTMDLYQVTPGVHGFAPWAPRCWRYTYLPDYITKPHIPLHEWLEPQRHVAHDVLVRYIRFLPHIRDEAERINPNCSMKNSCLAVHIRQSDKAAGRRQIQTDEFLPYVEAFVQSGGSWVYLATDSAKVVEHVKTQWPKYLQDKIRSIGDDIVRSNDNQAVFDIASHHQTNTEILIEILALAKCQFTIHGLSAVTETSIWINVDLHYTSVNLEDPEHLVPSEFKTLVEKVLDGGNATQIYKDQRPTDWWKVEPMIRQSKPTHQACNGFDGILHIAHVGVKAAAGPSFFTSVLNQLYYAEQNNLKPWIHLDNESEYIYDEEVHGGGSGVTIQGMTHGLKVSLENNRLNSTLVYPGKPVPVVDITSSDIHLPGDGIWTHYFQQVSDFVPGDRSCASKPMLSLSTEMVMPGLYSWAPWALRAWRNDDVPDDIWKPGNVTLKAWMEPQRQKGTELVNKYFKFHPRLQARADEVNPIDETSLPCMAVHLRNSDKGKNKYRSKFHVNKFREYINAFIRAGGKTIYIATDSNSVLEHINLRYSEQIRKAIRHQGTYVVRTTSKWPIHSLETHHRTNSEALVDVLAMSKCKLLLHGLSTLSEAAIYLNPELRDNSMNWEDPDRMGPEDFERLARKVLGTIEESPVALLKDVDPSDKVVNATVLEGGKNRSCRKNAIVYLAQKKHSTYDRDSYGYLLRSIDLVHKNYLSIDNHAKNTDLLIFHTSDFDQKDLDSFEERYGKEFRDMVHLVDLNGTKYWKRPKWHKNDDPFKWYAYPLFSEGYRRMMHWFAIDIWQYFLDYGQQTGCKYDYIMRFDEDSFLHSPVRYDIFDFMKNNDYFYGFRLCAYELPVTHRIWKLWRSSKGAPAPIRDVTEDMCGVYNNFFVAKVSFFQSQAVQGFLRFVDRQGLIYRRRLGDLMIHSLTIYAFAPPEKIHRFLDFTYEHATVDKKSGCVMWGGIQAGYDDPTADQAVETYIQEKVTSKGCHTNLTIMHSDDLSPTYAHLPSRLNGEVALKTATAGKVELPGKGILSG